MNRSEVLSYTVAVAWMAVVIGVWIAIDLGYAAPWLSFTDIPGGSVGGMAGVLGLLALGWYVIKSLKWRNERAEWRKAGQKANLRPSADGGDTEGERLTGTVDGRSVSTYYDKRKLSSGGTESGGRWVTFTFGEAELAGSGDEGVLVGPVDGALSANIGTIRFDEMAERATEMDGLVVSRKEDLVMVGTSRMALDAISDGLSMNALRAIGNLEVAALGDASGVVASWAKTRNEEMEGRGSSLAEYPVDNLVERVPGNGATVTVEIRDPLRDGEELRRFVEGVVVIADAYEEATARSSAAG
ncbi:hypothetical protein [Halodesulfurarchaeum sp.]|uniref:hypothetical protein n=1 Tax=Halodesulfurarchaeum sp. TaxID=1980530 RepID=UPI002FC34DD4